MRGNIYIYIYVLCSEILYLTLVYLGGFRFGNTASSGSLRLYKNCRKQKRKMKIARPKLHHRRAKAPFRGTEHKSTSSMVHKVAHGHTCVINRVYTSLVFQRATNCQQGKQKDGLVRNCNHYACTLVVYCKASVGIQVSCTLSITDSNDRLPLTFFLLLAFILYSVSQAVGSAAKGRAPSSNSGCRSTANSP